MNKQIKSYTDFTSQIRTKVSKLYCVDFGPIIELNCSLETQLNQSGCVVVKSFALYTFFAFSGLKFRLTMGTLNPSCYTYTPLQNHTLK